MEAKTTEWGWGVVDSSGFWVGDSYKCKEGVLDESGVHLTGEGWKGQGLRYRGVGPSGEQMLADAVGRALKGFFNRGAPADRR